MASYQDPRKSPKPETRRVTQKPVAKETKPKRPATETPAKPIFKDWAMF